MRGRSNSSPPGPHTRNEVTIKVAKNENSAQQTRTVSASQVRGFTQSTPDQRPTVYFQDPTSKQPQGRATQEHSIQSNVGAHFQHGTETHFGNVSSANINSVPSKAADAFKRHATHAAVRAGRGGTTQDSVNAYNKFMQTPRLVETSANPNTTHVSRSPFQDTSKNADARNNMIKSLKQGPLNANPQQNLAHTRLQTGGYSKSKDDWHVKK